MPKMLTEQALNNVEYVSIEDYIKRVDALTDFEEKMALTTRYLLAYGYDQQRDRPFHEVIHVAKLKMAQASARLRAQSVHPADEAVNPLENDPEKEASYELFIADPKAYLTKEVNGLLQKAEGEELGEDDQQRIANYQVMSAALVNDPDDRLYYAIAELDNNRTTQNLKFHLEGKFGGPAELNKAYEATKPGLLSRAFGTSSKAYSNLDAAYQAFNNPNHVLYGDMNSLDKAAKEYLQHRFPQWDFKNGLPDRAMIDKLSGTEKARTLFSVSILRSTAEERTYETLLTATKDKLAEKEAEIAEENPQNVPEPEANPNEEFQKQLLEDLQKDEALEAGQDEIEEAYHANFALDDNEPEIE